jgi:2-keto-3-deoxy-6-phosphogluconate aldolase
LTGRALHRGGHAPSAIRSHRSVTTENALDWLEAGALAVGIGGNLTHGDPADIQDRSQQLVARLLAAET